MISDDVEFIGRIMELRNSTIKALEGNAILFEKRGSSLVAGVMRDEIAKLVKANRIDAELALALACGEETDD